MEQEIKMLTRVYFFRTDVQLRCNVYIIILKYIWFICTVHQKTTMDNFNYKPIKCKRATIEKNIKNHPADMFTPPKIWKRFNYSRKIKNEIMFETFTRFFSGRNLFSWGYLFLCKRNFMFQSKNLFTTHWNISTL